MRIGCVAAGDGLGDRAAGAGLVCTDRSSRSSDPYFLYAASNAGSLLALLAYPFVIEPNLGLTAQSPLWRTGFLIMAALVLACGLSAWRSADLEQASERIVLDSQPAEKA